MVISTKKRFKIRKLKKIQLTKKNKLERQLKKNIIGGTNTYTCNSEKLGSGGFGTVLLCATSNKDHKVAVKLAKNEKSKKELENEIYIYSILVSENSHIVKQITDAHINFIGEQKPDNYLVLEYCNAGDLSKFVSEKQDYNITDILGQIFDGMNYLFKKNILHLDLKPGNILVNIEADGNHAFKIADFGLSTELKVNGMNKPLTVDITTMTAGTPIYKPTFKNIDRSTYFRDLYAFYCIMYYLYYRKHYNVIKKANKQQKSNIYETKRIEKFESAKQELLSNISEILMDLENALIERNANKYKEVCAKGTVFTKRGNPNLNISGINVLPSDSNNESEEPSFDIICADPDFYTEYYKNISTILQRKEKNILPKEKRKKLSLSGNTELSGTETQPVI